MMLVMSGKSVANLVLKKSGTVGFEYAAFYLGAVCEYI
jgi:hypothetical protein